MSDENSSFRAEPTAAAGGHPDSLPTTTGTGQTAGGSRLPVDDLIILNEEIAGMARAGMPLDQGLAALAGEMGRGRLRRITAEIAADLRAGHTLPEAFARQGGRVPPFYAGLVAAGLRSGRVSEVLATLTLYARSVADLRATIVGALFYPAIVVALAVALFGLVCYFIIPQYTQIYRDLGLKLPMVTEWVLIVGNEPVRYVVVPLTVLAIGLFVARIVLRTTAWGRSAWATFVYAVPIVGTLLRSARLAAFSELLAILVDNAVPLPEAFRLAGEASSDPIMAEAAREVQYDLSQGMPLGGVLRNRSLTPPLIAWMADFGAQRGTLGRTLHQVAEMYRRQAEMRAAILRNVLPPFLIIATAGVMVGLFAVSILSPLIRVMESFTK